MATPGIGVSQQDLDASRLVFVSVKDAKPKRKVAVPIPENGSWEQFIGQVQTKLKVASVGQVYLATTGERILRLDQLQDIDELIVVEGAGHSNGTAAPSHAVRNGPSEITPAESAAFDIENEDRDKYAKRQSSFQRTARRLFPSLFPQPGLPITAKDSGVLSPIEQVRRRLRRRRRGWIDPRTILGLFALVSSIATLVFVYMKASQNFP